MQNIQHTLLALTVASAALAGCEGGGEAVGTSEARITIAAVGSGSAGVRVTAVDDATSAAAIDRTVDLAAGSTAVLDHDLAPSSYTLHVDVFGDAAHTSVVASRAARLSLAAGETVEVRLTADTDAKNDGAIAIDLAPVPRIHDVDVQITRLGVLDILGASATATIHVDAVDPNGGTLSYFWSGLGIDGAVQGSSTLTLTTAMLAEHPGAPKVYVVVQNSAGATATAQVVFAPQNTCVLCGGYHVNLSTQGAAAVEAKACIEARASCTATCAVTSAAHPDDLDAYGKCISGCALSLAKCDAS